MATITLELPDQLAERLSQVGEQLPQLLTHALDSAGVAPTDATPITDSPLLQEAVSFLAQGPTPHDIVAFKFSPQAQDRLAFLLEQARSGALTAVENGELETYRQLNHLFILLKAQARRQND